MSFTDKKLEIAGFALAAVMVAGLGYVFKAPVQAAIANADVSYEMPRPKSFFAALFGLGLEDREISRKYVNPFDKKKADAKKAADAKAAAPSAPKAVAQKKADAKKTADAKKPSVDVKVVGADAKAGLSGSDIPKGANGSFSAAYNDAANSGNATTGNDNSDNKMSGNQWRALLSAEPTKENVNKLLTAYYTDEVDASSFYTIVNDLLKSSKSDTQVLGLYAVQSVYSAQSFAVVAQNYEQLASANQTTAHTYMQSYATSSRSGVLKTELESSNASVVEWAAQVVIAGYQAAKTSNTGSDPRSSGTRGDTVTAMNVVSDYAKFVSVFQTLAKSSDATIAGLASSALSQIQTTTVAAN